MQKEVDDHINNENFKTVSQATIPKGTSVLPGVWQMRRKRKINTREVHKWKARLNLDGGRMLKGLHCDHAHAPVAGLSTVRLMLTLMLAWVWKSQQLDCVSAFAQAPAKRERDVHGTPKRSHHQQRKPKGFCFENTGQCLWNQASTTSLA